MQVINIEEDFHEEEEQKMELIIAFVNSNQTTINDIYNALESGDLKLVHRLAHTLKSVAGIVNKYELSKAAQAVENSISEGKIDLLNIQVDNLDKELFAALEELTPIMENYAGKIKKSVIADYSDKQNVLKLLEKLAGYLEEDSYDSLSLVSDLKMISGTELLAEYVDNMEFGKAREVLAVIIKKMENEDVPNG